MPALRTAQLTCVALTLGLLFAHVLEAPGKLQLDGAEWLAVQHLLYGGFGTVGAALEVAAIAGGAWLAWRLWPRAEARGALAATLLMADGLALWAVFTAPANARIAAATPATLPADWPAWRLQWEASHAAHAALFLAAFIILAHGAFQRETTA